MKGSSSRSLLEYFEESDVESEAARRPGRAWNDRSKEDKGDSFASISGQINYWKTKRTEPIKRDISWGKHGLWAPVRKARAAELEKQLKARWALEDLIEEQLNSFQEHYNRVMVPIRLKDIVDLLMPRGASPQELAALTWLGDWRPSSILNLLGSLSSFSESNGVGQVLPQLVSEIRVEEAVIDAELAEIQATCVLHLPFGRIKRRGNDASLLSVQNEFRKIHGVHTKAQNLRFKVLELVAKKMLSQSDAAEFLVTFSAIQDSIHECTTHYRLGKGAPSQSLKSARGSSRGGGLISISRTKTYEAMKYTRI